MSDLAREKNLEIKVIQRKQALHARDFITRRENKRTACYAIVLPAQCRPACRCVRKNAYSRRPRSTLTAHRRSIHRLHTQDGESFFCFQGPNLYWAVSPDVFMAILWTDCGENELDAPGGVWMLGRGNNCPLGGFLKR